MQTAADRGEQQADSAAERSGVRSRASGQAKQAGRCGPASPEQLMRAEQRSSATADEGKSQVEMAGRDKVEMAVRVPGRHGGKRDRAENKTE